VILRLPGKLYFGIYKCSQCGELYKREDHAEKHKCILAGPKRIEKFTILVSPGDTLKVEIEFGSAITAYEL